MVQTMASYSGDGPFLWHRDTKAPTAKSLTYTGSAQELVTSGTASGGTMQYALGTATEATEQYTTSIPSKTNAGT